MYLKHFNEVNTNKVRGLMPHILKDPSYKELYDKGIPIKLVDKDIRKKYSFYEDTPFPKNK
jgi:hypothetical protein